VLSVTPGGCQASTNQHAPWHRCANRPCCNNRLIITHILPTVMTFDSVLSLVVKCYRQLSFVVIGVVISDYGNVFVIIPFCCVVDDIGRMMIFLLVEYISKRATLQA